MMIQYMAYIPQWNDSGHLKHTLVKEKNEDIDHSNNSLESITRYLGGSSEEVAAVVKSKYALDRIEDMDRQFKQSGEYDSLVAWHKKEGLNIPPKETDFYEASNLHEDALFWTRPEGDKKIIGINTNLDKLVRSMSEYTGLSGKLIKKNVNLS